MLIIARRVGQSFTIGDDIEVTLLSRKGNAVRLGIEAPKDMQVLRDDIKKDADGDFIRRADSVGNR